MAAIAVTGVTWRGDEWANHRHIKTGYKIILNPLRNGSIYRDPEFIPTH